VNENQKRLKIASDVLHVLYFAVDILKLSALLLEISTYKHIFAMYKLEKI